MTLAAFRELSKLEKQSTLLQAVVVDDPALIRHTGLQPFEHSDEHSNLLENMSQRTEHPFQISSHSHNHIQGRILLDSPRLLHFTIPYDAGWRAAVDGQPVPLERVNIGFTGLPLSAGEHRVELHYRQPYQLPSLALSVVGVSVFLLFRKRQPRPAGGDPAHRE